MVVVLTLFSKEILTIEFLNIFMICWHMFLQIPNFRKVAAAITNCTFKFFFFYFIFVCYLHIECFKHIFCKIFLNVHITLQDWRSCLSLLLRLEKTFPQNWQGTGVRLGVLISELLWDSLAFFFGGDPDQFSVSVICDNFIGLGLTWASACGRRLCWLCRWGRLFIVHIRLLVLRNYQGFPSFSL